FMTIPEAASLVLQAGALAELDRSGLFVLDMGRPVSILDLAVRFAEAHGLEAIVRRGSATGPALSIGGEVSPDLGIDAARGSVDVVITGARPGEKLHEELAYAAEMLTPTECPGVLAHAFDGDVGVGFDVERACAQLATACREGDRVAVVAALGLFTPELVRSIPAA
ncbi:MAG: polysaccharide biosynthesis protein, partial [Planctomycetota bacterium]